MIAGLAKPLLLAVVAYFAVLAAGFDQNAAFLVAVIPAAFGLLRLLTNVGCALVILAGILGAGWFGMGEKNREFVLAYVQQVLGEHSVPKRK